MAYHKRGLWLPFIKVDVESVTRQHRKPCYRCGADPQRRRMIVTVGTGRSQKIIILCLACAKWWVQRRMDEAVNLLRYLQDGSGCVRLKAVKGDPSYREPKEEPIEIVVNTRDEYGVKQPLDQKTFEALGAVARILRANHLKGRKQ